MLSLPASAFNSQQSLIKSWETFIPETLNQRFSRLLLSVNKKTSRLAVIGELSRYPLIINALIQSVKYKWTILNKCDKNSLIHKSIDEMQLLASSGIYRLLD